MLSNSLSAVIKNQAIQSSNGELAWNRRYILDAINEVARMNYAILGGDVWGLSKDKNMIPLSQTIDNSNIIVGILPCKDNSDRVYNWFTNEIDNEKWDEYVDRCKKDSISFINNIHVEEEVIYCLRDSIYYNLVFIDEVGYKKFKTKI